MSRSKIKSGLLFLPPAILLLVYFFLRTPPLVIVSPESGFDSTRFRLHLQTDHASGGHSVIALQDTPAHTLSYRYVLDNALNEPIARVFIASSHQKFIDISAYNTLSITLRSEKGKRVPVILCHPIHLHATPGEIKSYHLLVNYADAEQQLQQHLLRFSDFATPDWWYSFASNQEHQNIKPDITHPQYLVLSNSTFTGNKNQDLVTVSDLRFTYDFTAFFIWSGLLTFVYYLLYMLLFHFPKSFGAETIYLLYKKIETVNYEESEKVTVLTAIQQRFQYPELTIGDIQKETGIHERKISAILKKHIGLTFKQYVNQLRIEHAQKLLVETTLPVSAIAYESGYNNVSHFNRVFKTEESCSPQEYRARKNTSI